MSILVSSLIVLLLYFRCIEGKLVLLKSRSIRSRFEQNGEFLWRFTNPIFVRPPLNTAIFFSFLRILSESY